MAFLSIAVAAVSSRYFTFNPSMAAPQLRERLSAHDPWLLMHIAGGITALAMGSFQFPRTFRNRHFTLHRWIGRIYLLAVSLGAIAGFRIALVAAGGLPAHVGFAMLAVLWLVTATMAYIRVRQSQFQNHREWMIRNYALTFAAVTLRIWLPLLAGPLGYDFLSSYVTVSWLCWVPNMIVAEALVVRSRVRAM
jgi:uncharacterized membrane protein